jgi:hypothetical protein
MSRQKSLSLCSRSVWEGRRDTTHEVRAHPPLSEVHCQVSSREVTVGKTGIFCRPLWACTRQFSAGLEEEKCLKTESLGREGVRQEYLKMGFLKYSMLVKSRSWGLPWLVSERPYLHKPSTNIDLQLLCLSPSPPALDARSLLSRELTRSPSTESLLCHPVKSTPKVPA